MRKLTFLVIAILLLFSFRCYAETASSSYIRNKTIYAPVYTTTPIKGQSILSSSYGNYTKRISDIADKNPDMNSQIQSNGMTGDSTVNSDGTMVMVFGADSTSGMIYDISTETPTLVAYLKDDANAISANNEIGTANEVRWDQSGSHPKRIYFVGMAVRGDGAKFYQVDDVTNYNSTITVLHNFAGDFTGAGRASTADFGTVYQIHNDTEGMPSNDSRYWAFMARASGGATYCVFTYDKQEDDILGVLERLDFGSSGNIPKPNTVMINPEGTRVIVHSERSYTGSTTESFDDKYLDGPHAFPLDLDVTTYTTGTVTATNGSDQVVGAGGASFTGKAGQFIHLTGEYDTDYTGVQHRWYEIASVEDSTHMTLTENFEGTGGSGLAYGIAETAIAHMAPDYSHFGWGCDKSGNHVYVAQNNRNDYIIYSDYLGNWTKFAYEPTLFGAYPGIHFDKIYDCSVVKGWVLMDIYVTSDSGSWFSNNLIMHELDDISTSPGFWRIGHKYGHADGVNDYTEMHSNLDVDSTAVYWGTKWNDQFDNVTANHMEVVRTRLPDDWMCKAFDGEATCGTVDSCTWADSACTFTGSSATCDSTHCSLCLSSGTCASASCNWWTSTSTCNPTAETCNNNCDLCAETQVACSASTKPCFWWESSETCESVVEGCNDYCGDCLNETSCEASSLATCEWKRSTGACGTETETCAEHYSRCLTEATCEAQLHYWYNEICNLNPQGYEHDVVLDTSTSGQAGSNNVLTVPITTSNGEYRMLIVGVGWEPSTSPASISTVTANAQPCTEVETQGFGSSQIFLETMEDQAYTGLTEQESGGTASIQTDNVYEGTYSSKHIAGAASYAYVRKSAVNLATVYSRFRLYLPADFALTSNGVDFFRMYDGYPSTLGILLIGLDGVIDFYNSPNATTYDTGYSMPLDQYVDFVVGYYVHDTAGWIKVWADGVLIESQTAIDTRKTVSSQVVGSLDYGITINDDEVEHTIYMDNISASSAVDYDNYVSMYYCVPDVAGETNVVVTLNNSVNGLNAGVMSFAGVNNATLTSEETYGTGATASDAITTAKDNSWLVDVVGSAAGYDLTAGTNQTERYNATQSMRIEGSTKETTTAGEQSVSWTLTSDYWGLISAVLEPALEYLPPTDDCDTVCSECASQAECSLSAKGCYWVNSACQLTPPFTTGCSFTGVTLQ